MEVYSHSRLRLLPLAVLGCLLNCAPPAKEPIAENPRPNAILQVMSLTSKLRAGYERKFFASFGQRNGIGIQFVPILDSNTVRLQTYRHLFAEHSTAPDLVEIDIIWPAILADDLVDLRPYLKGAEKGFDAGLLANYIVGGRVVALPIVMDVGVLYYRPDLLARYGFGKPPSTWDELEAMAARIQSGERRRAGQQDFWGYTWQGAHSEGLTSNALEWQASAGAGNFLEPSGRVNVRSPRFADALRRATRWIGVISPPGECAYREQDSENVWNSGHAAFMRDWASSYGMLVKAQEASHRGFAVASLPGGPAGSRASLGGLGIGVSKYAANRELAIKALLEITDERHDREQTLAAQGMPTHASERTTSDPALKSLLIAIAPQIMRGVVNRPAVIAGGKYDQVSRAYYTAVNQVLRKNKEPEQAMLELEKKLMQITGFPAQHN